MLVQGGHVDVNGEMELRRGRKLFPGDVVTVADQTYEVQLSSSPKRLP